MHKMPSFASIKRITIMSQSTSPIPSSPNDKYGKFYTLIKPYLQHIDNGLLFRTPFSWMYAFMAIFNLLLPIYMLIEAWNNHVFEVLAAKYLAVFFLIWLLIAFVSWLGFQIWWNRKFDVLKTYHKGDEFVATPVFAHFVQTLGEWLGTWIGIVGFSVSLVATLLLGSEGKYMLQSVGLDFMETDFLFAILMPVYGFLIIVFSRFLAEQFKALTTIANNTRRED